MKDPNETAKELADHCRYCGMPDYRPKCKADYEHQVAEIAAALQAARVEGLREVRDIVETTLIKSIDKSDLLDVIDAEIAALERGKEKE